MSSPKLGSSSVMDDVCVEIENLCDMEYYRIISRDFKKNKDGFLLVAPKDILPTDTEIDFEITCKITDARKGKKIPFDVITTMDMVAKFGTFGQRWNMTNHKEGYRIVLPLRRELLPERKMIPKGTKMAWLLTKGRRGIKSLRVVKP